jgi:hypothetical protein
VGSEFCIRDRYKDDEEEEDDADAAAADYYSYYDNVPCGAPDFQKKNAVAHASLSVVQIPNGVLPAGQQGKYGGIGKACRNLIVINGLVCSGKS